MHGEAEVQTALAQVQKEHRAATHVCYAYILNEDVEKMKSSDNGEPQGTAGAPILHALQQNELTNILATVTRYFGGIKLGAGGLIRAYGKGVTVALAESRLALYDLYAVGKVVVDYRDHEALKYLLAQHAVPLLDEEYTEAVSVFLQLKKTAVPALAELLQNRFAGRYQLKIETEKILPQLLTDQNN